MALLVAAAASGVHRADLERDLPRVRVEPFDAVSKRMAVWRSDGRVYVKGAAEGLLPLCTSGTEGMAEALDAVSARGMRVLGVAVGEGETLSDLTFLGLIGLADPPRPEAVEAIAAARHAGIRVVMITGDHPVTAAAIARELGVLGPDEDPEGIVHARATPEQKIAIVGEWKQRGAIVAMTGDGVNDAPAIREAHVGAAMGSGTEVTREAADLVLTNDDFASLVAGVREGRTIYGNIQKTLVYLLSGNAAELTVMFVAALSGLPLPLLPIQLLWINLATDGLPALALVTDPPDQDVMERAPRDPDAPILGRAQWARVLGTGLLQAGVALGVFVWALPDGAEHARNLVFPTLVFGELFRAFAARSPDRVFFAVGVFTNKPLLAVIGLSVGLQIVLHEVPPIAGVFGIGPLTLGEIGLTLGLGLVPVTALELGKLTVAAVRRARGGGPEAASATPGPGMA